MPAECIAAPSDPLLYDTSLPYRQTFYPMGFAATIATNSESIIAAARSAWSPFRKLRNEPTVELRLAVSDSPAGEKPPVRMPRGQGHLVSFLHDVENFAICDLHAGFGFGWLTPAVAADESYVRYHFVENCIYILLESLYLTTAHAACVALNGKGVLLAGHSGAGKSTLSYHCARRGWTYVCDDAARIIRKSHDRHIVGNPYQIRFRPHAMSLYPELQGNVPLERPNGKPSLELDTASLNLAIAEQTPAGFLVFLNRSDFGPQYVSGYDKDEAFSRLSQTISYGDEPLRDEMRNTLRTLLTVPVFEMHYHDLDWAEQRLRSLVEHGR